jgi:hypothetical protein
MTKPIGHFYLAIAIISIVMAGMYFWREYPEAGLIHALNAMWTFVGYSWHSLCYKQRELINKIIDHYGRD